MTVERVKAFNISLTQEEGRVFSILMEQDCRDKLGEIRALIMAEGVKRGLVPGPGPGLWSDFLRSLEEEQHDTV